MSTRHPSSPLSCHHGDLNARVASSGNHRKTVGHHAFHQVSNDNGNRLIDICEATNMCIATTRQPHPSRHKWTWQHPNGKKAQMDHVIIRGKWINSLQNCRSYSTVEIDSDHRIVTARIKLSFRTEKSSQNTPKYDHNAILYNNVIRSNFRLELSNRFEQLTINEDESIQSAYNKFEYTLNAVAAKTLPKKGKMKNNSWVSQQSNNLIEQRSIARKKYQNNRNPKNYTKWREIAEQADS